MQDGGPGGLHSVFRADSASLNPRRARAHYKKEVWLVYLCSSSQALFSLSSVFLASSCNFSCNFIRAFLLASLSFLTFSSIFSSSSFTFLLAASSTLSVASPMLTNIFFVSSSAFSTTSFHFCQALFTSSLAFLASSLICSIVSSSSFLIFSFTSLNVYHYNCFL